MDSDDRCERWWIASISLCLLALLLLTLAGCSTAPECVPEIVTVPSPPEVVTILPPTPRIPLPPRLLSTTPEGLALAESNPAAWLRLLAGDLLRALDAYEAARGELEALREAREAAVR